MQSIKSPYGENVTYKKSIYFNVWDVSYLVVYILLLMFLLLYFNVLTISESQPTLYYFYSTSAQVFAALLGIIVMFSILILQNEENNKSNERNRFLKKGLVGFTILYIMILILSFAGIAIKDTLNFNSIEKIPSEPDINMFRDILSISIFEFVFLMIPAALLYLYAMISDFLKWDATFEVERGSLHVDPDTFNAAVKGADRIKVVIK